MVPKEAIEFALSKEQEAIDLYKQMALEHSVLRETMDFLVTEEYKHKQLLAKKLAELLKY